MSENEISGDMSNSNGSDLNDKVDDGIVSRIEKLESDFNGIMDKLKKSSGYDKSRSFNDSALAVSMMLFGGIVWWFSRWYWGIATGIAVMFVVQLFMDKELNEKAGICAEYFFRELGRHPEKAEVFFWAAADHWVKKMTGESHLMKALTEELSPRLKLLDSGLLEEAVKDIKKTVSDSLDEIIDEAMAQDIMNGEAEGSEYKEKLNARKLERIRKIDPDASLPVDARQINFHLGPGYQTVPLGYTFSVSKKFFIMITDSNKYSSAIKIPLHCINNVKISNTSDGFSINAITSKIIDPLFGKNPMRITVTFNLLFPVNVRGGWLSHYKLSFEIEDHDWPTVESDWRRFADSAFQDNALCPKCGTYSVSGKAASFSENIGMKLPEVRAVCSHCKCNLVFNPVEGTLVQVG
jgi:hypothetical protein